MRSLVLTVILLLNSIFIYSQEMKTLRLEDKKISIQYPDTWETMENPNTVFILIRPLEKQNQIFRENVNLIVDDAKGLGIQEYTGFMKKQLNNQLPGYKELSSNFLKINNKDYVRIIYRHNTNNLPLQVANYTFIYKEKAYQLTCSSTQSKFEDYLPIFEKMISSFRIDD